MRDISSALSRRSISGAAMKILALCLLSLFVVRTASAQVQPTFPERWNFVYATLDSDTGLEEFVDVLKQSKDVGCTHILMPEGRWVRHPNDADYLARVAKVKSLAKELNLKIVPTV